MLSLNLITVSLDFVPFYRHLEKKMDQAGSVSDYD